MFPSRAPANTYLSTCSSCSKTIQFDTPIDASGVVWVQCYSCGNASEITLSTSSFLKAEVPRQKINSNTKPAPEMPKREPRSAKNAAGTDLNPLDLTYYELLNVQPTASATEIKKAYYNAAMKVITEILPKYHPDKNPDDPKAEENFKKISEAYQVLSDPQKRAFYNQHGIDTENAGAFMDPEMFFKQQFGGEKFTSIIGEISIAREFKDAMGGGDGTQPTITSEERLIERRQRIDFLVGHLIQKLELFTNAFPYPNSSSPPVGTTMEHLASEALASFRIFAQVEVDSLKEESYGVELLHAIGYTYTLKADQHLALLEGSGNVFKKTWGIASRLSNNFKEKAHIINETIGTVKTAIDLQSSFTKLQEIEKREEATGQMDQELKSKLEQDAAQKGMEALWRGSKLEVESVLRDVCDETLGDVTIDLETKKRRAKALKVLGEVYSKAKI